MTKLSHESLARTDPLAQGTPIIRQIKSQPTLDLAYQLLKDLRKRLMLIKEITRMVMILCSKVPPTQTWCCLG